MYIYEKYNFRMFESKFLFHDRLHHFSHEALLCLFNYLSNLNEPYELDVMDLCWEFYEGNAQNVLEDFNLKTLEQLKAKMPVVFSLDNGNILYRVF